MLHKFKLKDEILLLEYDKPFEDIEEILGYDDDYFGTTPQRKLRSSFSWSIDKQSWSTWYEIEKSLLNEKIDYKNNKSVWIRWRYERIGSDETGEITLEEVNPRIKFKSGEGLTGKKHDLICGNGCGTVHQIVQQEGLSLKGANGISMELGCSDLTDFYALAQGYTLEKEMNNLVNQTIGIPVEYYRTEPDLDTLDVFLNEFSLKNVVEKKCIKVMLVDNEIPESKPVYDDWGVNWEEFEINISVEYFESQFPNKLPRVEDYILMSFMDRMYYIYSHYVKRGINGEQIYHVIGLKKYDDALSMMKSEEMQSEIDNMVTTPEGLFGVDIAEEQKDMMNQQQFTTQTSAKDLVREYVNRELVIEDEIINNNATIVSKHHYDLESIFDLKRETVAVEYRFSPDLKGDSDLSISAWFNLSEYENLSHISQILMMEFVNRKTVRFHLDKEPRKLNLLVGSLVFLREIGKYLRISAVDNDSSSIEVMVNPAQDFIDTHSVSQIFLLKSYENFILKGGDLENGFSLSIIGDSLVSVYINKRKFEFSLPTALERGVWHGLVFNLSNRYKYMGVNIWSLNVDKNTTIPSTTRLTNIYAKDFGLETEILFESPERWSLISSPMKLTNLRLWTIPIEYDKQQIVLNTNVSKDSSLAIFIDNANPNLNYLKLGSRT